MFTHEETASSNAILLPPDGIAWDWVTMKLYWTDADENDIEVFDPMNGNRRVLFNTSTCSGDSNPRAIVLDPTKRSVIKISRHALLHIIIWL